MAEHIGQQFGNYRLERLLGIGGFAQVYLGVHVHLGSQGAVKLLLAPLASAQEIEKFRKEAQTIAALQHPHIVRLLDFGVEEGIPYLVLDYAPNGSLRQRFPPGNPVSPITILPTFLQVAGALQYAHEQKLVHRDVKPENLLLGRNNEVLLTDFGIATIAQNTSQQRTEGVAGTAAYMAPEQLQGKPRQASDLYSLGVVVYEWLTGERPFQGGPIEVATQQVLTPPPPLREKIPNIPAAVEQVVLTALAKDPKERFGSVRAFANAFAQAAGAPEMLSTFFTLPNVPPAPAGQPGTVLSSQDAASLSSAVTQLGTPPTSQSSQNAIYLATTHVTPQLSNPALPAAPQPGGPINQPGPSTLDATTHLTPPTSTTTPNVAAAFLSPPVAGEPGTMPTSAQPPTAQTVLPPGDRWLMKPGELLGPPADSTFDDAAPAKPGDQQARGGLPIAPGGLAGVEKERRKNTLRRWSLIAAACLALVVLLGGGAFYVISTGILPPRHPASGPTVASAATVTIIPQSDDLKNTFTISGVTRTPDASQQQVAARLISTTTDSHSRTVNATGQGTTPGTNASGFVRIRDQVSSPTTVTAGTVYGCNNACPQPPQQNLHVVIDQTVTVNPGGQWLNSVPAHVQEIGTIGNMNCCGWSWNDIYVNIDMYGNMTGGVDSQPYTYVQQSDINNAANSLIQANQPDAAQVIQGQLQSGEAQVGTPQCSPNVSANHNAGDAASQVTVTVNFTCTGEAYNHDGALALARQLLTSQVATAPGAGYALVGQIKTSLVSATPDNQGTITIIVQAEGIWAYQFSDTQKQGLTTLIAGKSQQEAMSLLEAQTGVAQVRIQITGGNGQKLPTDPQKITLVIQPVAGL